LDTQKQFYFYTVYGLRIASEIVLPELLPDDGNGDSDVSIILQPLSLDLEGADSKSAWFQYHDGICQIRVQSVAKYRIERGLTIFIDPEPDAAPENVRLFLLGTVMGALMYQRNRLPLHTGALLTASGLWAFTGHSGAGKSTLVAELHLRQGYPLFSDDVAVVAINDHDEPVVYPGPPRIKLWQDALGHFGINKHTLIPDLVRTEKYHLQIEQGFCVEPLPLQGIIVLERASNGEQPNLTRICGMNALQLLLTSQALYRLEIGRHVGDPRRQFLMLNMLLKQTQVYRYQRPWSLSDLDNSLQPLLDLIELSIDQTA
jgi:hypothetical protein